MSIAHTAKPRLETSHDAKCGAHEAAAGARGKQTSPHSQRDNTTDPDADQDVALELAARAILKASSYEPVRRVSCEVRQHVLTLRGRVPTFFIKQMAQTIVRRALDADVTICNQLEVDWASRR